MKWKTELAVEANATVVSQEMSYKLKFGPIGALMNALVMRRKLDAGIRDVFAALKSYVEGRASR